MAQPARPRAPPARRAAARGPRLALLAAAVARLAPGAAAPPPAEVLPQSSGAVVDLTDADFDDRVRNGTEVPWLVKFYAPWCGHCKALSPVWEDLAKRLGGGGARAAARVARVDATAETSLRDDFDVRSYPALKLIAEGSVYNYKGPRVADALEVFARGGWREAPSEPLPADRPWTDRWLRYAVKTFWSVGLPLGGVAIVLLVLWTVMGEGPTQEDIQRRQQFEERLAEYERRAAEAAARKGAAGGGAAREAPAEAAPADLAAEKGTEEKKDTTYVVTSLAEDGDLFSWSLRGPRPGPTREALMQPIVLQIFTAVRWLHELGIAHRDLSLENVLLTHGSGGHMRAKLIDFGMATCARWCRAEVRGKETYQAPEMHCEAAYDAWLADAFQLGAMLFPMAAQDYPWASTKPGACSLFSSMQRRGFRNFLATKELRRSDGRRLAEILSPGLAGLLEGLLELRPEHRLCLGEGQLALEGRRSVWDEAWMAGAAEASDCARPWPCPAFEGEALAPL